MKKILTLAILLLILYPLLPMVYDNAASAQSWTLENGSYWMPNLDVTSTNEKCETCGHVYDPEEGHTCTFKCEYCGAQVVDMDYHYRTSLSCGNAAGGGENDEDGADEEPCGITGNMNDGYNIPNVTVIGNWSSNSGLWSIEIYCGGSGGASVGGTDDSSVTTENNKNNENSNDGSGANSPRNKEWIPGNYLYPEKCQTFFKNRLLIMPQQDTKSDCVSTALTYCEMWANDYPIEKYQEVKQKIERNFFMEYNKPLKSSGVGDSIIVDFVAHHSGLVTGGLDIKGIKSALDGGSSAVTILVCGRNNPGLHFISIVGYDCEGNYLYIDPEESKLCKCTSEELEAYPTARGRNCIFAIY